MTTEFLLAVGVTHDGTSAALRITLSTVREFSSYGYQIAMDVSVEEHNKRLTVAVGGLRMMPISSNTSGPARTSMQVPLPSDGQYTIVVHRNGVIAQSTCEIQAGTVLLNPFPEGSFVREHRLA